MIIHLIRTPSSSGETNPAASLPGTIRGDFAIHVSFVSLYTCISHGSIRLFLATPRVNPTLPIMWSVMIVRCAISSTCFVQEYGIRMQSANPSGWPQYLPWFWCGRVCQQGDSSVVRNWAYLFSEQLSTGLILFLQVQARGALRLELHPEGLDLRVNRTDLTPWPSVLDRTRCDTNHDIINKHHELLEELDYGIDLITT